MNENFTQSITALRKQRNLTQAQVADALGISDKTYSKWETGETDPSLSSVLQLADCFGVSPAYLLDSDPRDDTDRMIDILFENLTPEQTVQKSFEIQFHAIRALAERAVREPEYYMLDSVSVPENRVNPVNSHAITAMSGVGVYEMMYNGDDANISLSMLPHRENYAWLKSEQAQLSAYLSLIADADFLKCVPYITDRDFSAKYTAEYLASRAQIDPTRAGDLLERCTELGICTRRKVHIGYGIEKLYQTNADHMLTAILTLAHLSLPSAEKNGCWCVNMPAKLSEVN